MLTLHKKSILYYFLLSSFLFMAYTPFKAYGQQDSSRTYFGVVKWYPLQQGEFHFAFERPLKNKRQSVEIGGAYIRKLYMAGRQGFMFYAPYDAQGGSLRVAFRKYAASDKREAPFGMYHGPLGMYKFANYKIPVNEFDSSSNTWSTRDIDCQLHVASVQYMLGYQLKLLKIFTLNPYMGFGLRFKYVARPSSFTESDKAIGYALVRQSGYRFYFAPSVHFGMNMGLVF